MWIDVRTGRLSRKHNPDEIRVMMNELNTFIQWAKENPKKNKEPYSIACLTFYRGQEKEIRTELQKFPNCSYRTSTFFKDDVDIYLHTVDKFQGREVDITLISMVQNKKIGFLDSPNRLNVAMTRARFLRVIIGDHQFFKNNRQSFELNQLAEQSVLFDEDKYENRTKKNY